MTEHRLAHTSPPTRASSPCLARACMVRHHLQGNPARGGPAWGEVFPGNPSREDIRQQISQFQPNLANVQKKLHLVLHAPVGDLRVRMSRD